MPIRLISFILYGEDVVVVIEEVVNHKNFEKSDTEIETFESKEELHFPQEFEDGGIIVLDDLNAREKNDPQVQAIIERSRHNNLPVFVIIQYHYELPGRTITANGNSYHNFKPNIFRGFQNLYQDKAGMNMTRDEYKHLTSTCWDKKYQPLTIHLTRNENTGKYRLGLNILFFPTSSPF